MKKTGDIYGIQIKIFTVIVDWDYFLSGSHPARGRIEDYDFPHYGFYYE